MTYVGLSDTTSSPAAPMPAPLQPPWPYGSLQHTSPTPASEPLHWPLLHPEHSFPDSVLSIHF